MQKYWNVKRKLLGLPEEERTFEIAAMFMAYDNQRVIRLLKNRGKLLSKADYQKSIKFDKILENIMEDPTNL